MTAPGDDPASVTRDHLLPRSLGGSFREDVNRLIVCKSCNVDKGDMTLLTWLHALLRAADTRAECVAAVIGDLYANDKLSIEQADILVGFTQRSRKSLCHIGTCDCVGSCKYATRDDAALRR